jgi:hypothetical protein
MSLRLPLRMVVDRKSSRPYWFAIKGYDAKDCPGNV